MQPPTPVELVRGLAPHPAQPGTTVAFFPALAPALRHLRDHVLTPPESEAWLIVAPAFANHAQISPGGAQ